ncbi:MAG: GatB/YqeY domain-containing protein [Anaerolineaceae bacterium]|jgi:uncharacterized protein YqeY|nr:GatB/YqeY domain-containing protein [Anaerolineaceae bacterium]
MDTKKKLETALLDAMRSGDVVEKNTIRLTLTSIKMAEVENREPLDETRLIAIIQKEIKSRQETIQIAEEADRFDIVDETKSEIAVLKNYLPEQLGDDEILELARTIITETGAESVRDMGKVMKEILPRIKGRAPNDKVSQIIKNLLSEV